MSGKGEEQREGQYGYGGVSEGQRSGKRAWGWTIRKEMLLENRDVHQEKQDPC